jgi:hypothetical protein
VPPTFIRPLDPGQAGWPTPAVSAAEQEPRNFVTESATNESSSNKSGFASPPAIAGYLVFGALGAAVAMFLQWRSKSLESDERPESTHPWLQIPMYQNDMDDQEVGTNSSVIKAKQRNSARSTGTARTESDSPDTEDEDDAWLDYSDWSFSAVLSNMWGSNDQPTTGRK